jgi:4'-phosphopantetheinyl transferase
VGALFHVSFVALDVDDEELAACEAVLSPAEHARAVALGGALRRRFAVARGNLRRVVGTFLSREPESLGFEYGPHGKPELSPERGGSNVRFNLAHSRDLAVIALTQHRRIGVDVEYTERRTRFDQVSARYFTSAEREQLNQFPEDRRRHEFFRVWTRKEAYMKARGEGISQYLRLAEVTVGGTDPRIVRLGTSEQAGQWTLSDIEAPAGFVGAVAVEHSG